MLSLLGLTLLMSGCGTGKDTAATQSQVDDSCDTGLQPPTWEGFGWGFFRTYCSACHAQDAPDRHGAPVGVVFDSEADVAAQAGIIRAVVLDSETMPVGGGVDAEELRLLERYLDCGIVGH